MSSSRQMLSINGVVLALDGLAPIQGATVSLGLQISDPSPRDPRLARRWIQEAAIEVATGADGRFTHQVPWTVGKLALVAVTMLVRAQGHKPFVREFTVEALDCSLPLEIVLEKGRVQTMPGEVVAMGTGKPVAGLPLQARAFRLPERGRLRSELALPERVHSGRSAWMDEGSERSVTFELTTDSMGRFELELVGIFSIFVGGRGAHVPFDSGAVKHRDARGPMRSWDLELDVGATLIVDLRDEEGGVVADAGVQHEPMLGCRGRVIPDSFGRCRVIGLKPGLHRVAVHRRDEDEFLPLWTAWGVSSALPDVVAEVSLGEGETRTITVIVPRAAARLICSVRHADGSAAEGLSLWLTPKGRRSWDARPAHVDAEGKADFGRVSLGEYAVLLSGDPNSGGEPLVELALRDGVNVAELVVPHRYTVRGTLRGDHQEPVTRAHVSGYDGTILRTTETDENGAFELPFLERTLSVSVFGVDGYENYDARVVNDGQNLVLTLVRESRFEIRARIVSAERALTDRSDVLVEIRITEGGRNSHMYRRWFWKEVGAGDRLSLSFPGLTRELAGLRKTVVVRLGDHVPFRREVDGGEEELDLGDLALDGGVTLRGRIEDPEKLLGRGGHARIVVGPETYLLTLQADAGVDGSFEVRGVPREPVIVRVSVAPPPGSAELPRLASIDVDPRRLENGDLGTVRPAPVADFRRGPHGGDA